MEPTTKIQLLDNIGKVYEASKKCRLEITHFEKLDAELCQLSSYLKTPKIQSFFIAMVFALNYKGDTVDLNDLIDYFDCNPMKILEFSDDFAHLATNGIFEKEKSRHRVKLSGLNDQFTVNEKITEAILQNKPMPNVGPKKITDVFEVLEKIYKIGEARDDGEIPTAALFFQTRKLLDENSHFPLIKRVDQFNYDIADTFLYLYLIWKTLSGDESTDVSRALEGLFSNPSIRFKYMQNFLKENNALIKNNWVELVKTGFFNDTEMKLTDKSNDFLSECGISLFSSKQKKENIITPEDIPLRKLIFNDAEMQQFGLLKNLLQDTKFSETQKRLTEKGLPKGIAALFHGVPGTGKTETVKQLAKCTDRELMNVDISQSKSMWFGESEKVVKKIFTDYQAFAKTCERMPILLFNEADAILSKRKNSGSSNVTQTENAIQNIILEELENFEGILMATTNLAGNLDSAFERRFLFKLKFNKPDKIVKQKIWQLKMPQLTDDESGILADAFDFSGGQIDNVVRKCEIQEIIYGEKVGFLSIFSFCDEESLSEKRIKIGFDYA
jgi:AAA+ superfamily predicted ATPase